MRKLTIKCDCCETEIEEKDVFSLEHYVHVSPSHNRMAGHSKMIDGYFHSISQRMVRADFCLKCYNILMGKFFDAIKEHKDTKYRLNKTQFTNKLPPPIAGDKIIFRGVGCLVTRPQKVPKERPYNIDVMPLNSIDDIGGGCGFKIEIPSDHPEIIPVGINIIK